MYDKLIQTHEIFMESLESRCTFIGYIPQEVNTLFLQPCLIAVFTKRVTVFLREISSIHFCDACIFPYMRSTCISIIGSN